MVMSGAESATLWSSGVDAQSGWYDFNKARGGEESCLCWAITASNMIAWWQGQQETLPAGVPTGEAVWAAYKAAFDNSGSDPDQGLRWWFSGKYQPDQPQNLHAYAQLKQPGTAAYYPEGEALFQSLLYRERRVPLSVEVLTRAMYEGFSRGDTFWIGVGYLRRDGSRHTHSLNVWGMDYELSEQNEPQLKAIYITDSDDGARILHRIPLRTKENRALFDCAQHPLYGRIGDITINNYSALRVRPQTPQVAP